jgi:predicted kinase
VTTIRLPQPALVVLVGAAGSGKTTLAARLFDPADVVSSDAYRAAVSGDEADQSVTRTAFSILHREVARRLADGRLVVVDATNVQQHARRSLLRRAAAHGTPAIALVLALPATVVQARNAARLRRVVDPAVVTRHLALLATAVESLAGEGFAAVHVFRSEAEVADIRLVSGSGRPAV